jgi:hypothetical protein
MRKMTKKRISGVNKGELAVDNPKGCRFRIGVAE